MSLPEDIPFEYTTITMNGNPSWENTIVRESALGRILMLTDGLFIRYSDDNGQTWTIDPYQLYNPEIERGVINKLFLDSDRNLITLKIVNSGVNPIIGATDPICRFFKRDRVSGAWTTYDLAIPSNFVLGPDQAFGVLMDACQTDDGTIHVIKTVVESTLVYLPYYSNIHYWSFKDGVFSGIEQLTFYSAFLNSPSKYMDIFDGDFSTMRIMPNNGNLLIFWTMSYNDDYITSPLTVWNNPYRTFQYCIKGSNIDVIRASHQWYTGIVYIVGMCVIQGGSYYKCLSQHTSGTFGTDLAGGKWEQVTSFTIPTIMNEYHQIGPVIDGEYGSAIFEAHSIISIRDNGNLFFLTLKETEDRSSTVVQTYHLFRNFIEITPVDDGDNWSSWLVPYAMETAMNDDIMLYGTDKRLIINAQTAIARISNIWYKEHTANINGFGSGHTYNFNRIR